MATKEGTAVVEVKAPWFSKVNWTQVIGFAAMMGTMFGLEISAEMQTQILAGIIAVQSFVTMIIKTFFTTTVATTSVDKPATK